MKYSILTASILLATAAVNPAAAAVSEKDVAKQYTTVAHAVFQDALTTAENLDAAVDKLVANPSEQTLADAKAAWKAARVPYQQSEVFRFGNTIVDDWEGQLNAWPLDEGLIDYVAQDYTHELGNPGANLNIIASKSLKVGGETLDATNITPDLLASLNELGGSEANVATGYHAIEFLLWGQDLHGTDAGAGERPYTDFVEGKNCTGNNCDRRVQYLQAATDLLIADLKEMEQQWAPGQKDNYAAKFQSLPAKQALTRILYGMGSLSLGELAGERMKVALEANSPEDEHDCFSDNTHFSHFYNWKGIENVYFGKYTSSEDKTVEGTSLADLVAESNPKLSEDIQAALKDAEKQLKTMVRYAEKDGMKFDQMIGAGNEEGAQIIRNSIQALVLQTQYIEEVAGALGIDNLNPDTADHDF